MLLLVFHTGSGSGQQSVTGQPTASDANSYWIVHGKAKRNAGGTGPAEQSEECTQGTPLHHGDTIRLLHASTSRYLHSHLHRSPLSAQQEVSAFGGPNEKPETGDNWRIELDESGSSEWTRSARIRLRHVDTEQYLSCHDKRFGRPISGQLEVFASGRRNKDSAWHVGEAVLFPPAQSSSSTSESDEEANNIHASSTSASTSNNASEL